MGFITTQDFAIKIEGCQPARDAKLLGFPENPLQKNQAKDRWKAANIFQSQQRFRKISGANFRNCYRDYH